MNKSVGFEVVYEAEEAGGYHVYAPALKGCHSYGESKDEARKNIAEAIEAWLEAAKELGLAVPDHETIQVTVG